MKISAKSEYAVLALLYIYEESPEIHRETGIKMGMMPITPKEICKYQHFPGPLLRRILQCLAKEGILRSIRGKNGGYIPRRQAEQVNLLDVVSIFEPRAYLNNCTTDTMLCLAQPTCRLASAWQKAQAALDEQLRKITYASLLRARPGGRAASELTMIGLKPKRQQVANA